MTTQPFKAVKVCDDVYWVGAIDWGLRDFHGYTTSRGSSYNAFLITSDQPTLIDTVKAPFFDEMMSRIASVIEPSRIRNIVSHHAEMDHSGALPQAINVIKPERVYASQVGVDTLKRHFHWDVTVTPVKDGETVSIGNMTLTFLDTKMLHWPESNASYLAERKVLFSQDIFGMHLASSHRYADEENPEVLRFEATKYYANIVMPYSPIVARLLKKVAGLNIPFEIIAPDHGPIWRKDINTIVEWYAKWADQKPTDKVVIVYDTMWKSTELMARVIADGAIQGGSPVKVMCMAANNRSDIATEILEAGALLVGSPTINNNMFPSIADVMMYLKGLKPRGLIGGAFGSFGWSGESVKQLEAILTEMGVTLVDGSGINVKYRPEADVLARCYTLGLETANRLKQYRT